MLILIIMDDASARSLKQILLTMGADQVVEADSVENALMIMNFCVPDIVIGDWQISGMSSLSIVKDLRSRPEFKNTPIVMCTTESGKKRSSALLVGVSNWLIKPIQRPQLEEKIRPLIKAAASKD